MTESVAVVTGAGSGIGAAVARGFGHDGYRVVVADITDTASAQHLVMRVLTLGRPGFLAARGRAGAGELG